MFWMIGGIYASAMAWAIIPHYGRSPGLVARSGCAGARPHRRVLSLSRLELPDGLRVPIPQLEGLRPRLRLPLGLRHRGAHHHAGEPTLLP